MGHMTIAVRAAERLSKTCSAECTIVSDHDTRSLAPTVFCDFRFVLLASVPHQCSVGGCVESAPIEDLVSNLKDQGCDVAVFLTFFSSDAVRALKNAGIRTVLLTFPLRDSHWEAFCRRGYEELFSEILVFADVYDPTITCGNQAKIAPLCPKVSKSLPKSSPVPKILALVGGGGRPSAEILRCLVRDALPELISRGVNVDLSISLGATPPQDRANFVEDVEWRSDLPLWVHDYDLVISEAGFNVVTEFLFAGYPAFLVPGIRRIDNQELRAVRYADQGCGVCLFPEEGPVQLANRLVEFLDAGRSRQLAAEKSEELAHELFRATAIEEFFS